MKTAIQSVFLDRGPAPVERDFSRVLILGGDNAGLELAKKASAAGFEVILTTDDPLDLGESILTAPATSLAKISGFAGAFETTFELSDGLKSERVGAIVDARPSKPVPKFHAYGLSESERCVSFSKLESLIASGDIPGPRGAGFHVAFLHGLKGESNPAAFGKLLDAMDSLTERFSAQTYVFTGNVKVGSFGLEARYRDSREKGAIYFKFDGQRVAFEEEDGSVRMVFVDPILNEELELVPDLVVVDEDHIAPELLGSFGEVIPSASLYGGPSVRPDSTRFTGVWTPKAGLLAVGPSRGSFDDGILHDEISAALATLLCLRADAGQVAYKLAAPEIDPARCAVCLTCVRLCPHGAMTFHKVAVADETSCVRCGICASECPNEAITLKPSSEPRTEPGNINDLGLLDGKIVAFLCSRSAAQAWKSASLSLGDDVAPIVVQCAGTVGLNHILSAFAQAAGGVLIAGCHKGNCASVYGTDLASGRAAQAKKTMEEAGLDPDRLLFASVAANTPGDLAAAVDKLKGIVGQPG